MAQIKALSTEERVDDSGADPGGIDFLRRPRDIWWSEMITGMLRWYFLLSTSRDRRSHLGAGHDSRARARGAALWSLPNRRRDLCYSRPARRALVAGQRARDRASGDVPSLRINCTARQSLWVLTRPRFTCYVRTCQCSSSNAPKRRAVLDRAFGVTHRGGHPQGLRRAVGVSATARNHLPTRGHTCWALFC